MKRAIVALVCMTPLVLTACGDATAPGPTGTSPVIVDLTGTDPAIALRLEQLQQEALAAPNDAAHHAALGMGYEVNGMLRAAADSYALAVELAPAEARYRYYLAQTDAKLGNLERAIDEMRGVTERVPGYASAWLYLGHWQLDIGRTDDAVESFSRARATDPSSAAAVLGLARARLDRGEVETALELLEPLIDKLDHPHVYQLLARAYRMTGDQDRAREIVKAAGPAGGPPMWSDPWNERKTEYRVGFAAELKRAQTLFESGATADAIALLERLRESRPGDRTLLNNLSAAYSAAGRTDDALAVSREGAERYPDFYPFQLNLAGAYAGRGDFEAALEHVDRAIALNPMLGQAHQMRAVYLLRLNRQEEALDSFEQVLRSNPDDRQALATAAGLAATVGNWATARRHAEAWTRLDTNAGIAWVILGRARAEQGDYDGAAVALDRAHGLTPDDPRLLDSRRRLRELRGS